MKSQSFHQSQHPGQMDIKHVSESLDEYDSINIKSPNRSPNTKRENPGARLYERGL